MAADIDTAKLREQMAAAMYGKGWDSDDPEKRPGEKMKDVWRDYAARAIKAMSDQGFAEKAEAARLAYTSRDGEVARLEAQVAERDAEIARLTEALEPFADFADFLASETTGFSDADELEMLTEDGHLLHRFRCLDFRRARAAISPPQQAGSEPRSVLETTATNGAATMLNDVAAEVEAQAALINAAEALEAIAEKPDISWSRCLEAANRARRAASLIEPSGPVRLSRGRSRDNGPHRAPAAHRPV